MNAFFLFNELQKEAEHLFRSTADQLDGLNIFANDHLLVEADDKFVLEIDLPGVSKQSISAEFVEGSLLVKAERKAKPDGKIVWDGRTEKFQQRFKVKAKVDQASTKAEYVDGVLRITIPKDSSSNSKISID